MAASVRKLSLGDALDLSGGSILPSKTRYVRLNLENKTADEVSNVEDSSSRIFGDGDILLVNQSNGNERNRKTLN